MTTKSGLASAHKGDVARRKDSQGPRESVNKPMMMLSILLLLLVAPSHSFFSTPLPRTTIKEATNWLIFWRKPQARLYSHIVPPTTHTGPLSTEMTLRKFLLHPDGFHLALAPAFFGFFAQFGILQAWDEALSNTTSTTTTNKDNNNILLTQIQSLAGSSAGAMTAILLGAGIPPAVAVEFCEQVTLDKFADPPGTLALFQGNLFLQLMTDFLQEHAQSKKKRNTATITNNTDPDTSSLLLQDSLIPVAVTAWDLRTRTERILTRGSMPLAARASACFPFLFSPVKWMDDGTLNYLIDGGIDDMWGLEGLAAFYDSSKKNKKLRVVNVVVGSYPSSTGALGPSEMPIPTAEVVSISIRNTPQPGPWAMENGPRAAKAATDAMMASLDLPLYIGKEKGHYELHIDATEFVPAK